MMLRTEVLGRASKAPVKLPWVIVAVTSSVITTSTMLFSGDLEVVIV